MTTHALGEGAVGAHEETLVPNTEDRVKFAEDLRNVEVLNLDEASAIYVTVDGSAPTVGGEDCIFLPPRSVRTLVSHSESNTEVRLISEGAATYSVSRVTG